MHQPGTGFTTEPGVAVLRRTPGTGIGIDPNPNGVPHPPIPEPKQAFAMWNPVARWGLEAFVSHFPRALPWAVTLRAFGTEHMVSRPDCASLVWIVITILPETKPGSFNHHCEPDFCAAQSGARYDGASRLAEESGSRLPQSREEAFRTGGRTPHRSPNYGLRRIGMRETSSTMPVVV